MQVLSRGLQISMPKQNLDGPQVGTRFQQMSGPTVSQSVWCDAFVDAGPTCGLTACDPDCLIGNRLFLLYATHARRKQVDLGLTPAPILPQGFQQGWAERQIAIFSALAGDDTDDHSLAINVADLEVREFGATHAGAVERHQQRASKQRPSGVDETRYFLSTEHRGQSAPIFGIRQELSILGSLERLYKEESQSGYTVDRSAGCHLALSEQVRLITSQLIGSELIWRLAKVASERSYVLQVLASCDLRIVAALEFLQHHLA